MRNNVYVIPNALIAERFQPCPPPPSDTRKSILPFLFLVSYTPYCAVTIVVIARLAYRKGIDLLVATAPRICARFPNVNFVIGGDGPKLIDLLQMREKHRLQDRIELLGAVKTNDVRSVRIITIVTLFQVHTYSLPALFPRFCLGEVYS